MGIPFKVQVCPELAERVQRSTFRRNPDSDLPESRVLFLTSLTSVWLLDDDFVVSEIFRFRK